MNRRHILKLASAALLPVPPPVRPIKKRNVLVVTPIYIPLVDWEKHMLALFA
jgi:hypothetical protein